MSPSLLEKGENMKRMFLILFLSFLVTGIGIDDVYAAKPLSRDYIYVNAHTGEIVHTNAIIKTAVVVVFPPNACK